MKKPETATTTAETKADAARAALRERFPDRYQPHDLDLAHFWINDVSGDSGGGMLDARY